jgi:serine/threonine protein kinase
MFLLGCRHSGNLTLRLHFSGKGDIRPSARNAKRTKSKSFGRTISHYTITGTLGVGGMGEVYRATDNHLGREVALKVLPSAMPGDPSRLARFQQEARAVTALNHPHIVTLFSVDHDGDVQFLTMELIHGQPLDHAIPEHGMSFVQVAALGRELAEIRIGKHMPTCTNRLHGNRLGNVAKLYLV